MCILWVYVYIFVVWLKLSKKINGGQEHDLTEALYTKPLLKCLSYCKTFFSCNTAFQLTTQFTAPSVKAFKRERKSTNTGKNFSHHSVQLNVEFNSTTNFQACFANRYLIPVSATHLSRKASQFFIPSGMYTELAYF